MIKAFSLFELLIYVFITTILYLFTIPALQRLIYLHTAKQSLQQIELSINYARSIAILHHRKIYICPNKENKSCGNDWRAGLLVVDSGRKDKPSFRTEITFNGNLQLWQSGHNNYQLTIDANGMTSSNGHFNLKPARANNDLPTFSLYFNKSLRTYTIVKK